MKKKFKRGKVYAFNFSNFIHTIGTEEWKHNNEGEVKGMNEVC